MTITTLAVLAFLLGVVAGLRSMTAPAAAAWGIRLGQFPQETSTLAWLGSAATAWILAAAALGELVADKLPTTPSRTKPGPFAARILTGALSGAALSAGHGGTLALGAGAGVLGAVVGTLGGYAVRTRLGPALGASDSIVALLEDAMALGGALLIVTAG